MSVTIKYLRKREWKAGNGQCPECYGNQPNIDWWTRYVGHERNCPLAQSLKELGAMVTYKKLNPERVIRWEWNSQGMLVGVRANDYK